LRKNLFLFIAALFMLFPAFAALAADDGDEAEEYETEPSFKLDHYYESYIVNNDGSAVHAVNIAKTILKETALGKNKKAVISYSTSLEKTDIVEAYTKKADGRRINVPESNFQMEVNSGKGESAPAFSDRTRLTVVFPSVEVGDTVYLSYKITQKEAMFPGYFSVSSYFPKNIMLDDMRLKLDYPASMDMRYDIVEMKEKNKEEKDGRKIIEWGFENQKPVKIMRNSNTVAEPGTERSYAFSNFPSYVAIAKAYNSRVSKKAVVSERIRKLADKITKGKSGQREQAKALYEWVRDNITYAGNGIGVGAVVPRDLDMILDNRMGDCKDHTTLLQALLNAKNIGNTQALLNSGKIYHLPKVPVASTINHVINYLPDLDIYLDSTVKDAPFGMLPPYETGKTVFLVDYLNMEGKTPVRGHDSNKFTIASKVKINEDGSAKGSGNIMAQGWKAANMNAAFKNLSKEREEEGIKKLLRKYGLEGTAQLITEDKPSAPDIASFSVNFDIKDFIAIGSAGAVPIPPLLVQPAITAYKTLEDTAYGSICEGGHLQEDFTFEFPENVKILAIPENMYIANNIASYTATYKLEGNIVTVTRKYDEFTDGPVCDQKAIDVYKQLANKVTPNLKAQILYK
jgi:hypothetical protein